MAIFDLFSKRQKRLRGDVPDIYSYDELSNPLRVQIVHVLHETLGLLDDQAYGERTVHDAYKFIVDTLCREYGVFHLIKVNPRNNRDYISELTNFFLQEDDLEKAIDTIELSFRYIDRLTRDWDYLRRSNASELADSAIIELNGRFKEHGVGFQFIEGEIIRIDSELIHTEAVKPALHLLNNKNYKGAQQEFLSAYEHYRHNKNKEALNDCLKSFESTMKAICDKRKWVYQPNATAKNLITICFDNDLVPAFWQTQLSSLRSMLESSIPTGRNKLSGHGQGSTPISIPDYLTAYMLHMTASTLVFLIKAEEEI